MIDSRALTWQHFFPPDATFTVHQGPEWICELETSGAKATHNSRVLISEGRRGNLPQLDAFMGLAIFNNPKITDRDLRDAGFRHIRRFGILPSIDDARWFVPLGPSSVTATALQIYTPFKVTPRLKHAGLRMAALTGILGRHKHQVIIALRTESKLEEVLQSVIGDGSYELVISTGTLGPTRKPTIAMLDPQGVPKAYAKIGRSTITKQLMRNEAQCLRHLAIHPQISDRLPRLLWDGNIEDYYLTVQSPVNGHRAGTSFTPRHEELLRLMQRGPHKPALATDFISSLLRRSQMTDLPGIDLRAAAQQIRLLLADTQVPNTVVHGDFAPWNIRHDHGNINSFDWEYGHLDGLPMLDNIHFQIQVGRLIKNWTDDELIAQACALSRPDRMPRLGKDAILGLHMVYNLHMILQNHEVGHRRDDPGFAAAANALTKLLAMAEGVPI